MTEIKLDGYCGLYCGDCPAFKGEIADLAGDLRRKLDEADFGKASQVLADQVSEFKDYSRFHAVLGAIAGLRCRLGKGCRRGEGSISCEIRGCCSSKVLQGCWEYGAFETCEKLNFLMRIHGDAHLKNLRRIKKYGIAGFIDGKRCW